MDLKQVSITPRNIPWHVKLGEVQPLALGVRAELEAVFAVERARGPAADDEPIVDDGLDGVADARDGQFWQGDRAGEGHGAL